MKRIAIIGGGAAGFFCAIRLKELQPHWEVTIFEVSHRVLTKVELSGGGRCNCTNTFAQVRSLNEVYPRGARLMQRLFHVFGPSDTQRWFEKRGVALYAQDDGRVFPKSNSSLTIVQLFLQLARQLGVEIRLNSKIQSLEDLQAFDAIVVTTGSFDKATPVSHFPADDLIPPVPSLFGFRINAEKLQALSGTTVLEAEVKLAGTKLSASGSLLITHQGLSGPAVLRLSSYAARFLAEQQYHATLLVNWLQQKESEVAQLLQQYKQQHPRQQLKNGPFTGNTARLTSKLWNALLERALPNGAEQIWGAIRQKDLNRLCNVLTADTYQLVGRAAHKDEFVTCGGVSLQAVHPQTMESKTQPGVYLAGEVLDIDGVTGGFNLQAAWTTAFVAAEAIAKI